MTRLVSALRGALVPFVLLAVSVPALAQGTPQRGGTLVMDVQLGRRRAHCPTRISLPVFGSLNT